MTYFLTGIFPSALIWTHTFIWLEKITKYTKCLSTLTGKDAECKNSKTANCWKPARVRQHKHVLREKRGNVGQVFVSKKVVGTLVHTLEVLKL